jgi:hypothetical protein
MGELLAQRRHVLRVVREARRDGNRFLEVTFRVQFPSVHLLVDEVDEAAADLEDAFASWSLPEGVDPHGNQYFWTVKSRTLIATYRGDLARDARALDDQWTAVWRSILARVPSIRFEAATWEGDWRVARAVEARERGDRRDMAAQLRRVDQLITILRRLPIPTGPDFALRLAIARAAAIGDLEAARARLPALIERLDARRMGVMAAAARMRLGELLGGDEGAEHSARGRAFLSTQGTVRPDRIAAALMPGWPHPG